LCRWCSGGDVGVGVVAIGNDVIEFAKLLNEISRTFVQIFREIRLNFKKLPKFVTFREISRNISKKFRYISRYFAKFNEIRSNFAKLREISSKCGNISRNTKFVGKFGEI